MCEMQNGMWAFCDKHAGEEGNDTPCFKTRKLKVWVFSLMVEGELQHGR